MRPRHAILLLVASLGCTSRPSAEEPARGDAPGTLPALDTATPAATALPETEPADEPSTTAATASTGEVRGTVAFNHSATAHDVLPGCKVVVRVKASGAAVATAVTDTRGSFSFRLEPGPWVIDGEACRPASGRLPAVARREIVVTAGAVLTANFTFSDGTRCLDASARIDTPAGPIPVAALRPGDTVWARDADGARVAAVVVATRALPVPSGQRAVRLALDDGRRVTLSAAHPLADGRLPRDLAPGDPVDGARVAAVEAAAYSDGFSYDFLTTLPDRPYFAGGIALLSTMR